MVGRELELVWGFARVRRNVALLGAHLHISLGFLLSLPV